MSKTKGKTTLANFIYPPHDGLRVGIKVSWYYYRRRTDALLASDVAKKEAPYREAQGYDFGYQSPGRIAKMGTDDGAYAGMYEVCVP